jgi:hypothetical protein
MPLRAKREKDRTFSRLPFVGTSMLLPSIETISPALLFARRRTQLHVDALRAQWRSSWPSFSGQEVRVQAISRQPETGCP